MQHPNRLKGKRVFITGATAGIGEAAARQFAAEGADLILTGRRKERLEKLQRELSKGNTQAQKIEIREFDVRDRDACRECADSIEGDIDILINNAGLASGLDPVDSADFDDWDRMIDTNIKGLLNMTRFIAPRMRKRNSGHIINIGSIAGLESYPGGSVYCGTKHAVKAITRAMKMDLHGTGVRVSEVSPGLVETEFSEVRFHGNRERASTVYNTTTPLSAMDVAEIILFVATRPAHVNILDTVVLPTSQSSSTMVHREE